MDKVNVRVEGSADTWFEVKATVRASKVDLPVDFVMRSYKVISLEKISVESHNDLHYLVYSRKTGSKDLSAAVEDCRKVLEDEIYKMHVWYKQYTIIYPSGKQ